MQLKKHAADMIKQSESSTFIADLKRFSSFYENHFIKKLTITYPLPNSLIGQNALILMQTNLFRSKKIAEGFIDGLNKQNPLVSTMMVRAFYETTGVLALLFKKYNQYKNNDLSSEELEKTLESLYLGIKDKRLIPEAPDPFNVMKLIDATDHFINRIKPNNKEKRFRTGYDKLSEICHPNSFGYFLGHNINEDFTINFTGPTEPFKLAEYHIWHFGLAIGIYQLIYEEMKNSIILNEELPFLEFQKE